MRHGTTLIVLILLLALPVQADEGMHPVLEDAYSALDQIRDVRQDQLEGYLQRLQRLAGQASTDAHFQDYFKVKQRYHQLQGQLPAPPEVIQSIEQLKASIRDHYLQHYPVFYDILFVDKSGFVLSTIRHERDYHEHLFSGRLAESALSRQLLRDPERSFVDYDFYWASDEPSAFFVEPMVIDGQREGWLVCQSALNRINRIFTREDDLGQTGEVFLANRRHQMLTASRLHPDQGALLRHLAAKNLEPKFSQGEGHRRVIDYRGYPVLTSFTLCRVQDSDWLLVAKIDEDEILTKHFRQQQAEDVSLLERHLPEGDPTFCAEHVLPRDGLIVDMDEFRSSADAPLLTFGISTCTALLMILPSGEAILGHASENDRIYGGTETDLLGNMLRDITRFRLLPYEVRDLKVVLIAPHDRSLGGAVQRLLAEGLLLSQIRFARMAEAESATLAHDPRQGSTLVRWRLSESAGLRWQCLDDLEDLGQVYQSAIAYP
ncbi:cache domain-containing protein [Lamprobacter modestohalophilus]|uniref:cache domain-containing protein n=1 Tax=Lamprobacter modestohalophilus TaxID=1064514 RepID=UPI00190710B8|nr:cache domain-containing protein [Lamprobacter modestohalophilus]